MPQIALLNMDTGRSIIIDLDTFATHEPDLDAPQGDPQPADGDPSIAGDENAALGQRMAQAATDASWHAGTPAADLAEYEARNAGDGPPPVQPADTDPTAQTGLTPPASTTDGSSGPTGSDDYAPTSEPDPTSRSAPSPGETAPPAAPADTNATNTPTNGAGNTAPAQPQMAETACPACQGTGSMSWQDENGGTNRQPCGMCHGAGKIRVPA